MIVNEDKIFINAVLSKLGLPYKWGGQSDIEGYDCSGLVVEILIMDGVLRNGTDMTAQGLFNHFQDLYVKTKEPTYKSLAFYGASIDEITHVGYVLSSNYMIEAGGGDRYVRNMEMAIKKQATVRLRHPFYRRDLVAILRP